MSDLVPVERVEQKILFIRGEKVLLDSDLAELYGVETGALNRAFKRNLERFPEDFAFQLTEKEDESLRCHFGISKEKGGRRYLPYVFTEQGVAMLSGVLQSPRAVLVNVAIMRTFVKLRKMIASNKDLAQKLAQLEKQYDHQFKMVFDAIRELMTTPPAKSKNPIGFRK
ncbi:MAG: ORF6N domain-containing protein [Deltaproteobacteria bacterium]|nr:ORF6N domain-containing protein [Deltaproteobacteria bacterium]